ncbi:MAG: hypothetical protein M9938_06455 [Solirubrobacterales bacterium]|nr:hypothetical protein [Solirubrobacterales bacterium]
MADWPGIRRYLTSEYRVETETGEYVSFRRPAGDGRTVSVVVVDHGEHYGRSWVGIGSPVGRRNQAPGGPTGIELLKINADLPCGGLALTEDGTIMLEYAVRINDMDPEGLEDRIAFLAEIGAELGEWFNRTGRDPLNHPGHGGADDGNLG